MNKSLNTLNTTKAVKATVAIIAAAMFFTGCSSKAADNQQPQTQVYSETSSTQTETEKLQPSSTYQTSQATSTTSVSQTQASSEAVSTSVIQGSCEYPSENLETLLGAENFADLKSNGTISAEPKKVNVISKTENSKVEIEKVETFKEHFIIVTLNTKLDYIDTSDISIKKYSDNWYSLSPTASFMKLTSTAYTLNDEGKTVIIYAVEDTINGITVAPDYSSKKLSNLSAEITKADNYLSWQMDHGGWDKGVEDQAKTAWTSAVRKNKSSGWTAKNGEMIGTIDNDATYTQMRHIASVYREVKDEKYKQSVLKGLDFIFKLQYESGGFAQVYPERGNYSDYVTFNDNAMVNVLIMLEDMKNKAYPFDSDIIPDEYMPKINEAIEKAIDYILKAQIVSQGKLTAWCAQHDPVTYEPRGARAYELPSISGSESVGVVKFLINQEQTPEIKKAVDSAIQWFKDSEVKGIKYVKNDPNKIYFVEDANSSLWYRFYDIDTNLPIFCDRDGIKKHSITEIGEERRNGYSWCGSYPRKLLTVYDQFNGENYANKIELSIANTNSYTASNEKFEKGSTKFATSIIE